MSCAFVRGGFALMRFAPAWQREMSHAVCASRLFDVDAAEPGAAHRPFNTRNTETRHRCIRGHAPHTANPPYPNQPGKPGKP
ncbi:hypothetical protein XFF6970_430024 [Xanthomonas citri pv. fuscans]|nr:hypothetical protein XFF6970_430024 [Xanthomonas citri pv. fuscans]